MKICNIRISEFLKCALLRESKANRTSSLRLTFLLATPNLSELEIKEYTPKLGGCLSVLGDGSKEYVIKFGKKELV